MGESIELVQQFDNVEYVFLIICTLSMIILGVLDDIVKFVKRKF